MPPAEIRRRVTLAVGEVAADQHVEVLRISDKTLVARDHKIRITGGCLVREVAVTALLLVVEAIAVPLHLNALEVVVHDEVHDTRDSVRAIDRRRTAGEDFDTIDQR